MTTIDTVGVLGYGEAGETFADAFLDAGYDVAVTNRSPAALRERLADGPPAVADSPAALARRSDLIVSCVWPATAVDVAEAALDGVGDGRERWFYDVNSVSPRSTARIDRTFEGTNTTFLNGAIMGGASGPPETVRLTVAGVGREPVADRLRAVGFDVASMGDDLRGPAVLKLSRSAITKGILPLIVDATLLARHYGLEEELFEGLDPAFATDAFDEYVHRAFRALAAGSESERRLGEAREMLETAADAGYRAPTIDATHELFRIAHAAELSGETREGTLARLAEAYRLSEADDGDRPDA
jgi:3-hydroxyisobutyrate dehydrogenase-like beta-hydroxyacid dehydrogenase